MLKRFSGRRVSADDLGKAPSQNLCLDVRLGSSLELTVMGYLDSDDARGGCGAAKLMLDL